MHFFRLLSLLFISIFIFKKQHLPLKPSSLRRHFSKHLGKSRSCPIANLLKRSINF